MENEKNTPNYSEESNSGSFTKQETGYELDDEKKTDIKKSVLEFIKIFVISLLVTNLLNVFVFTLSQVRQSSMETTLVAGDQLIVEKLSYTFGYPDRGDVVVFISREIAVDNSIVGRFARLYKDVLAKFTRREVHYRLVKRIIGIPGDEIDIRDGKVYLNGEELKEDYINQPTDGKTEINYPIIVPAGQYFVMGDNRHVSYDSRDFECIKLEHIEGKVWLRFWPLNKLGGL